MKPKNALFTPACVGVLYAVCVLVWLPLYLYNGYLRLIDAKAALFYLFTVAGALLLPASARAAGRLDAPPKPDRPLLYLAALCLVYLVNLLFADNASTAFFGLWGRHNGTLTLLMCAVCYCIVRAAVPARARRGLLVLFLGCGCLVALLGWLNYFMFDPLDVYYTLTRVDGKIFLSTIGNITFHGAFVAMAAAAAAALCMDAASTREALLFAGATAFLTASLIPSNSDGAWIGMVAALAVLVCGKGVRLHQVARLSFAGAGFCLIGLACGLAVRALPVRDPLRAVSALAVRPAVTLPGMAVLLALAWLLRGRAAGCARLMRALAAAAALLVIALLLVVNCTYLSLPFLKPLEGLLRFGPRWGSNRGYVWSRLLGIYQNTLAPLQKLLGVGGDQVYTLLNPRYTKILVAMNGQTFDSAHNVYLQHLLCGGALGAGLWIAFWGASVRAGLRRSRAAAAALAVYCAQAFFSIDMPVVLPAAFVLAALCAPAPADEADAVPRPAAFWFTAFLLLLFGIVLTPLVLARLFP